MRDSADAPPDTAQTLDELSPADVRMIIQALMLGGDDPMSIARKAGLDLQDLGELVTQARSRDPLRDSVDLLQLHHFAIISRLKSMAAEKLRHLLSRTEPKLDPLRSTKVIIDLCIEILKLEAPE